MNKLMTFAAAGFLLASSAVYAANASDSFNVTVAFTGGCSVKTAAADLSLTYTSFQGAAATDSTTTVFQCSRGLTPTFNFDNTGATQTGSAAVATGTAITAEGLIAGIRYTLAGTTSKSATGTAAAAGANGTGGTDGSADEYSVSISANAAAGQAGSGSGATASQTRTLYINY